MEKKEQWAEDVLVSFEEIQRASPSDALFSIINAKITEKTKVVPMKKVYWLVVAASILIAVNIFSFLSSANESTYEISSSLYQIDLVTDYNLYK